MGWFHRSRRCTSCGIAVSEQWRDIAGYENRYKISSTGRIMNYATGRVLRGKELSNGYRGVQLGRGMCYLVHRLVLTAFDRAPEDGEQGNHKNGIRADNRLENLEWHSCSENHKHSYRELKRKQHALIRKVLAVASDGTELHFPSVLAAAQHFGVVAGSIASAAMRNHKCKNWSFSYV